MDTGETDDARTERSPLRRLPPLPMAAPGRPPAARLGARLGARLAQLVGPHVAPELLALWLIEVLAGWLLLYALLAAGLGDGSGTALALRTLNQATALALTFGLTSAAVGLYSPDTYWQTGGLLRNTAIGAALAFPAIWLVGRSLGIDLAGISAHAGQALLAWTLFLFGLRLAFSYALRANLFVRRVLVIGNDAAAARLAAAIATLRRGFFDVVAVLPAEAAELAAATLLARRHGGRVWGVVVTADAAARLTPQRLRRIAEHGRPLYSVPEFWERQLRRVDIGPPGSGAGDAAAAPWPPAAAPGRLAAALQRLFDIALSLSLLLFTLPLMLLTALAVRLDSPGPALYRQTRVGLHGRVFTLLKFRSMRIDAEAAGPAWAAPRDPRVTRVGAVIRLARIDELPQLLNVLRGEMRLIGPRPERPHFVAQLEHLLPAYRARTQVKPGLTGWAQVNYPYGASVEDARAKLSYDLYYVKHRSLLLDLLILAATVRVVLFRRGAR